MAGVEIYLKFLLILFLSGAYGLSGASFPLKDCRSGRFDMLVMWSEKETEGLHEQTFVLEEIVCIWSNRLHECMQIRDYTDHPDLSYTRVLVSRVVDKSGDGYTKCNIVLTQKGQAGINICDKLPVLLADNLNISNILQEIELKITIAKEIYTDFALGREKSTQVAIISVNKNDFPNVTEDEILRIPDVLQENRSGLKVLVVVCGASRSTIPPKYLQDTVIIESYIDPLEAQTNLCKDCLSGWFPLEFQDNIISCHRLEIASSNVNWVDASDTCNNMDADLSVMETKEELETMRVQLFLQILLKINLIRASGTLNDNSIGMFFALRRDPDTVAKRFRWNSVFGSRPLVINHWLPGQPSGGFNQGCGMWFYGNIDNSSAHLNESEETVLSVNNLTNEGWLSVGCGEKISPLILCENPRQRSYWTAITIAKANVQSFNAVSKKSDFLEFEEKIISVSANLNNETFLSYLKEINYAFPMFDCGDESGNPRFIPYTYLCDSVDHCPNRWDETSCYPNYCSKCFSGQCFPPDSGCNLVRDCVDGYDERDGCPCYYRRCCDGTCLPPHLFNDGEIDCNECKSYTNMISNDETDSEDELSQSQEACAFVCNNRKCIYPSQLNDNKTDCRGPEGPLDETVGKLEWANSCSDKLGRPIWAPRCVYLRDRYGAVLGCRDLSHLQNCSDFPCQEGYTKCPGSYCIPIHYVMDIKIDCPLGEEEGQYNNCTGNFACSSSQVCLHPDLVCDGKPDCPKKDDELNCDVTCSKGLRCIAGTVTVENATLAVSGPVKFIFPKTRYVNLSGININNITYDVSSYATCEEISYFYCSHCHITDFKIVQTNMKYCKIGRMDLSYNDISAISGICSGLAYLRALNLSMNVNLENFSDSKCTVLEILDLSHTGLLTLEDSNFKDLENLKYLNLSNTRLSAFQSDTFPPGFTLQALDLRGSPIIKLLKNTFNGLIITKSLDADNFGLCCPQIRGSGILGDMCHVTEDAISSCNDLISLEVQRILLWVMAGAALFGNLLVILFRLIWDRAVLKLAYGLFVLNLGISDLIMGLYLLMIAVADVYYRGVYVLYDQDWRESVVCKIAGFLATFSSESTTFFVFLITLDRFLVLRFPYGQVRFSKTTKLIAVVLSWCVGFMLAVILVLPVFDNESVFTTSAVCVNLPMTTQRVNGWGYSFGVFIVLNFIMFLFTALGQIGIFRSMSANRMSKEATNQNTARRAQDITVAKQLSLVVLSNFLCWFPIGLMGFLSLSGHQISNDVYAWTVVLVLPVNAAINPLLYTIPVLMAKWEKFKYKK